MIGTCKDITTTLTVYARASVLRADDVILAEIDHVRVTVCTDGQEWWVDCIALSETEDSLGPEYYLRNEFYRADAVFPLLEALVDRKHIESEFQSRGEDDDEKDPDT